MTRFGSENHNTDRALMNSVLPMGPRGTFQVAGSKKLRRMTLRPWRQRF
jgi:hypothetical protein